MTDNCRSAAADLARAIVPRTQTRAKLQSRTASERSPSRARRPTSPGELEYLAHVLRPADFSRVRGDRPGVHAVVRDQIQLLARHADFAQRRGQLQFSYQNCDEVAGIGLRLPERGAHQRLAIGVR